MVPVVVPASGEYAALVGLLESFGCWWRVLVLAHCWVLGQQAHPVVGVTLFPG